MLVMDGYSVVVPPEWHLFDLLEESTPAVDSWIDQRLLGLGADVRRVLRPQMRQSMLGLLAGLKERDASSVLVPSAPLSRSVTNPILVIRLLRTPKGTDPVDLLVAAAASDPSAELMEEVDFVGLRTTEDRKAETATAESVLARLPRELTDLLAGSAAKDALLAEQMEGRWVRRVRYLAGRPDAPARWLEIDGSVGYHDDPGSRELTDAITKLFDAVVGTLTWETR